MYCLLVVVCVVCCTRYLTQFSQPPYFIQEGGFLDVPLEHTFDLIHGRYVLIHNQAHHGMLDKIFHHLKPGGALITQATSPLYDRKGFWCIGKTIESAGFQVASLHVEMISFGQWGFHLATKHLSSKQMVQQLESMQ